MYKKISLTVLIATIFLLAFSFIPALKAESPATNSFIPAQQAPPGLPNIVFLGEAVDGQVFTIDPSHFFVLKSQIQSDTYDQLPGPTYTYDSGNHGPRVWDSDQSVAGGFHAYHDIIDVGPVDGGCRVDYVQIDDDIDTRRNTILLDGNPVQVIEQGMVVYGSVTFDQPGHVTVDVQDSVGYVSTGCQFVQPTATPMDTPPPGATDTPAPPTNTPAPPNPTNTPGSGGDNPTAVPAPTDTPIPTPAEIPALGAGPGASSALFTGIVLLGLLLLLAFGWWRLANAARDKS